MKMLHALMWLSVGVAGLGLLGCGLSVGGRSGGASVYVGPQEPEYVMVPQAPPPAMVEQRPPPPSGLYIWIDGYWNWNDRYVWERGHWAAPPHEHATWVAPRYESHEQGYRYAPGHWKVPDEKPGGAPGRSGNQRQDRRGPPDRPEHR